MRHRLLAAAALATILPLPIHAVVRHAHGAEHPVPQPQVDQRPRRQLRGRVPAGFREAAVRLLVRADVRDGGGREHEREGESLHAHTTSVCSRRP